MDNMMPMLKERVQKISMWVRLGCVTLITLLSSTLIIGLIFLWTGTGDVVIVGDSSIGFWLPPEGVSGEKTVPLADFSISVKILTTLGIGLYCGWFIKALYHLHKLFYYYTRGSIFTTEANGQIKQIGITGCLMAVSIPLVLAASHITISLILEGRIDLSGITSNDLIDGILAMIFLLVFSATIICVSWVMERGREMQEDQELTI